MVITMIIRGSRPGYNHGYNHSYNHVYNHGYNHELQYHQSEGWERISAPPGHVISQGSAPGARVVTCRGGGGGNSPKSY